MYIILSITGNKSEEPIKETQPKPDLGAALAAHAETQTQAYRATAKGSGPSDDKDREAVKDAILAQYGNSVVEESEEEEDDEDGDDLGRDKYFPFFEDFIMSKALKRLLGKI